MPRDKLRLLLPESDIDTEAEPKLALEESTGPSLVRSGEDHDPSVTDTDTDEVYSVVLISHMIQI